MRFSSPPDPGTGGRRFPRSRPVCALVASLVLVGALAPTVVRADQEPAPRADADVLATLRSGHPRLYVNDDELARIRQGIESQPLLKTWYDRLQRDAARLFDAPPVVHELVGPRLLTQSRRALDRISLLAGLYRLDGDRRKFERARKEMLTAAAFPDWNPSHFLDTAEMTNALAIGYDWLYKDLSEEDRATIRRAIIELGLKPGLKVYESDGWWPKSEHNWNQVCNGGMTAGALAIADEEPELARTIVDHGRKSIGRAMASFAPDGGWAEGPGYWNYATKYNVFYLDAIRSALGTDFDLRDLPGFPETGEFRMHSVGPIGKTFNYADAGEGAGAAAQMLWLARTFQRPDFAAHEIGHVGERGSIDHLFYSGGQVPPPVASTPLDALFRGVDVVFFRSAWNDPQATYIGLKGGDNKANHSHLDLGSFVLDALGHRWVTELGTDDYNLPGYFGRQRWTYYRLNTAGQNTLMLDDENQDPKAEAPIIAYQSGPSGRFAVADLSAAYGNKVKSVLRGVQIRGRDVLLQDEVTPTEPVEIAWQIHTPAEVQLTGNVAVLTQGDDRLVAHLLAPAGVAFTLESATPPKPQRQNEGIRKLVVRVPRSDKAARIAVLFAPGGSPTARPDWTPQPLEKWIAAGRLPEPKPAE